jgi:DNA-binding transcriptional MerR regulator
MASDARLTLSAVTRLTGLSAHLVRAWESRYGFPTGDRTRGGHRRYSTVEAERLRQAAILTRSGIRAADAIAMIRAQSPRPGAAVSTELFAGTLARQLIAGDKLGSLMQLRESWLAFGLSTTLETVAFPALRRVGELWASGEISVAEEHAASGIVGSWLGSLRTDFPWDDRAVSVLIAAPEGEEHAAGVWALELLLGERGIPSLALGASVPTEDLVAEVRRRRPRALVLGVARRQLRPVLHKVLAKAMELPASQRPLLLAGGAGTAGTMPDGLERLTGTVSEAAARIERLLAAR